VVWNDTRRRLRDYHAALGALERGSIPASLAAHGSDVHAVARALVQELRETSWRTGARHEVPLLITRCKRLAERGSPGGESPQRGIPTSERDRRPGV
jgi:hypothetical protein